MILPEEAGIHYSTYNYFIFQLRFSVLEFPAITVCNQNQFRKDRIPEELSELLEDFLDAKRADMFGGEDKFSKFRQGK